MNRSAGSRDHRWPEGSTISCSIWRGGTSRALIFRESDLPDDPAARDAMILAAMGSPDMRQIDGIGGAHPLTSKVAICRPATDDDHDVIFTFGQVALDAALVDFSGTCGNISAAIGPWAIDQGIVEAVDPLTVVRVLNSNTGRSFAAHVPVAEGRPLNRGDAVVDGVPGSGALIRLEFLEPAGGYSGSLFPTRRRKDTVTVRGSSVQVTIVDVGNPTVFIGAESLPIPHEDIGGMILNDHEFRRFLMDVREEAGRLAGIVGGAGAVPAHVPKIAIVGIPTGYGLSSGRRVRDRDIDLRAWALTMGQLHPAFPVTASMATAVAARLEGTLCRSVAAGEGPLVRIGHPSGVLEVDARISGPAENQTVEAITIGRTARRIMDGTIMLP